jgi:hypothetical protein
VTGALGRFDATRAGDALLDALVVAFAAWTVVYHGCAVLHMGADWAAAAWALALGLAACGWAALRVRGGARGLAADSVEAGPLAGHEAAPLAPPPLAPPPRAPTPPRRRLTVLLAGNLAAALAAAALLAFTAAPWLLIWLLWVAAAAAALLWISARADGADGPPRPEARRPPLELAVVAVWALGLAAFALLLANHDDDDAYYVHLSSWIAAHGSFPLRDVVFTDQILPALYFPPVASYEALAGTLARVGSLRAPDLVYYAVPPLASALAVLATWRLLRAWRARMPALALSVALTFLLFDAAGGQMLGGFFVARMWQGKVLLVALLVPLLFALLHEYARRPTRRRLALLAAAGIAGVGLTTTAVFVVPLIAAGCLAALAPRAPRVAAAGFVATIAYPAGAAVATLALGGRVPDDYADRDTVPAALVHLVLGTDLLALVGLAAVLIGPLLIPRPSAARMVAATVLLVGCLFAPGVPALVFHLSGLGRVLWRLTWALPVAALAGVLATGLVPAHRPVALRLAPAAALAAALLLWGAPLWSLGETRVAARPAWKRPPDQLAAARTILAAARPGDVILAPQGVSQTLLIASGDVKAVAPRTFYAEALAGVPGAHAAQRLRLQRFADTGLGPAAGAEREHEAAVVRRALRAVGVDLVCLPRAYAGARRALATAGYATAVRGDRIACLRASNRNRRA